MSHGDEMASNSHMNCLIWPKIKLVQDFMAVLITCKSDVDSIKKWNRHRPDIFSIICLWETKGQVNFMWTVLSAPNSNLSKIVWLPSWNRYRPDNIFLSLWSPQGRETLMPSVESGPKPNVSEIKWLPLLSASLMKIRSKMKLLPPGQQFPHYMSMETFGCCGNQSSNPICPKT